MKIYQALPLAFIVVASCSAPDMGEPVSVRIKVVEKPKAFLFPGCECGRYPPKEGQVSVVDFVWPKDLSGKRFEFFHLPPLPKGNPWEHVGAIYQFSIPHKAIGSAYPEDAPNHTSYIPYSYYIDGALQRIQEKEQ